MAVSYEFRQTGPRSDNGRMAELKTKPTDVDPRAFLESIPDPARRQDCAEVFEMMSEVAGQPPVMWGGSIIGFGSLQYQYASGHGGTWFRVGFASRKQALTLYLMLDLDKQGKRLGALGKHKRGKGCLYIKRLADVDREVLRELIAASFAQDRYGSCGPH